MEFKGAGRPIRLHYHRVQLTPPKRCTRLTMPVLEDKKQRVSTGFARSLCGFVHTFLEGFPASQNHIIRNMQHLMQGLSGVSGVSFRDFLAISSAALFDLCRGLKTCVSSFPLLYHGFRGFSGIFCISFRYL